MAKRNSSVPLPSGQGGLISGFSSEHVTRFQFSPQFVVYFALAVVFFIILLFNM